MGTKSAFNPALNLESFATQSEAAAPPAINAVYLRDGKYDGMTRADVNASFNAFRAQSTTNRLALFFHGGLVDKTSGQQSAANEYKAYEGLIFPLFFVWESGFQEVLAHHLPLIFAETIFGRVLNHALTAISSKVPSAAEVAPAGGSMEEATAAPLELTSTEIDAFMHAITNDPEIQSEAMAIAQSSQSPESLLQEGVPAGPLSLSPRTLLSPEVVSSVRGAFLQANRKNLGTATTLQEFPITIGGAIQVAFAIAKAAVPAILNIIRRFAQKRDHGLPCTMVEEILRSLYQANFGSAMWEEMKKETEDAFGTDSEAFGGTAVIEEICALVKEKPETIFTLVGHSTGGVYIGNFLQPVDQALTAAGDSTTTFDIILLAPANTEDFYASTYKNRVRGVRIFQMKDATEQQDHLLSRDVGPEDPSILSRVYPRSLLYLVAGVCEDFEGASGPGVHAFDGSDMPILGMDRYYALDEVFSANDYPSLGLLRSQFPSSPDGCKFIRVLSPTDDSAPEGFRSGALKHGSFPGDAETIDSLRACFKQGL